MEAYGVAVTIPLVEFLLRTEYGRQIPQTYGRHIFFNFISIADFETFADYLATNYESTKLFTDIGSCDFVGIDAFE